VPDSTIAPSTEYLFIPVSPLLGLVGCFLVCELPERFPILERGVIRLVPTLKTDSSRQVGTALRSHSPRSDVTDGLIRLPNAICSAHLPSAETPNGLTIGASAG